MSKLFKDFNIFTIKELEYCIEEYFEECKLYDRPLTMSGLALSIGVNRITLIRWKDINHKFKSLTDEENILLSNTIQKAKDKVEQYTEEQLYRKTQVAGTIFALKNNFNEWKDSQEINTTSSSKVNVTGLSKEELKALLYQDETQ